MLVRNHTALQYIFFSLTNKYLLSTYSKPGTVLGVKHLAVNKGDKE